MFSPFCKIYSGRYLNYKIFVLKKHVYYKQNFVFSAHEDIFKGVIFKGVIHHF